MLLGCGKGPRHLSDSDYGRGKTAFEALERDAANFTPGSIDGQIADEQIAEVSDSGLRDALEKYRMAILVSTDWSLSAQLDRKKSMLAATEPERQTWEAARSNAAVAASEAEKVLLLCHDDAAGFFDENAATTHTCDARLADFEKNYPQP